MRVLQVIGVMDRGGAETMVMNLYRAMDKNRIQFDFLVHEQREGDYDAEIRKLGGRFFRLPRFTGVNEHSYRKKCRELFSAHPEWAIVHGHIGSCAPIYLGEAKRAGKYTIAHSHAQNFVKGFAGICFNIVAHPVRHVADYFMACSNEAGLDRFGENIVKSNRFSVLPNGIDLQRYVCDEQAHEDAKESLGLKNCLVLGHVGRFAPEKNHAFLLEVFAAVLACIPNAVLVLAGRGPLENDVRQQARELGIEDAILFLGIRDDVPDLLRAVDVFVLPSTSEGLAMAAVEAQASGALTVLSTGVPALAVVCDRARRLSLSEGVDVWAQVCVDDLTRAQRGDRHDCVDAARRHGFDIVETSAWLERFYEQVAIALD